MGWSRRTGGGRVERRPSGGDIGGGARSSRSGVTARSTTVLAPDPERAPDGPECWNLLLRVFTELVREQMVAPRFYILPAGGTFDSELVHLARD